MLLFLWFFLVTLASSKSSPTPLHPRCNVADRKIYKAQGSTFEHRFRAFGGLFVGRSAYEAAIVKATGLSLSCARCYGKAYLCGFHNCKWKCAREGKMCTKCLERAGCIKACNKCSGFVVY